MPGLQELSHGLKQMHIVIVKHPQSPKLAFLGVFYSPGLFCLSTFCPCPMFRDYKLIITILGR